MTGRRLGWIAGAALLFCGLTALFMALLAPLAERRDPAPNPRAAHPERSRGTHGEAVRPSTSLGMSGSKKDSPAGPPASAIPTKPAPFRPDWTGPRVALLVTDAGDNPSASKAAADALPFEVGFAFPPAAGQPLGLRERWLSMPMQPTRYPAVNPGPDTLLVGAAAVDNLRRLDHALGEGAPAGVTSMMGSAFTVSAASLAPVMQALKSRGLPFIDARATPASLAAAEARKAGVATATNKRFVAAPHAAADLKALEASARREGRAVGFAAADPATVAAVAAWAKGLEARGLLLVRPSDVVR